MYKHIKPLTCQVAFLVEDPRSSHRGDLAKHLWSCESKASW